MIQKRFSSYGLLRISNAESKPVLSAANFNLNLGRKCVSSRRYISNSSSQLVILFETLPNQLLFSFKHDNSTQNIQKKFLQKEETFYQVFLLRFPTVTV